ncbi:elongation factor P [bacterium]|nr:elongation factor P [candidate division CSSED10-310 bacterium]
MLDTTSFRSGLKIEYEGEPYIIVDCQHVKPGKGVAFVKTRMKNLRTGTTLDVNFRSGDKVGVPDIETKDMQYLYQDGDLFYFMDMETYDQKPITEDQLGDTRKYIKENSIVSVLFYKGVPISVEVPMKVELRIVKAEPGVRGDTAQGATKPAVLETGAIVQVPLFVEEGEIIRVDTRTNTYIERVRG